MCYLKPYDLNQSSIHYLHFKSEKLKNTFSLEHELYVNEEHFTWATIHQVEKIAF